MDEENEEHGMLSGMKHQDRQLSEHSINGNGDGVDEHISDRNSTSHQRNSNTSHQGEEIISFDKILSDVGIGKYQARIFFLISLIGMAEGSQITIFTLTLPILKHQWNVEDYLNSLQASLVFLGILCGSLISGQVADRLGRRIPFVFSSFLSIVFIFVSSISQNIYQLILLRLIMGFLVGFFGPLTMTVLTEITPQKERGRFMSLVTISVSIGQLFALVVGYFVLDNFTEGNWRLMTLITGIPGLIGWLLAFIYLDDSARYLIVSGEYEKGFEVIEKMNSINGCWKFQNLTTNVKEGMINWSKAIGKQFNSQNKASVTALFKGDLQTITPIIWVNMFSLSLIYYGIIILLPSLLDSISQMEGKQKNSQEGEEEMTKLILSSISEMVAGGLASLMIEVEGFGRKNSIINFGILQGITLLMVYYDTISRFVFWVTLAKFYQIMNFTFSYQFIAEVYSTTVRTTGIGIANSVGKVGGMLMPWICSKLQEINLLTPFLLFSAVSIGTSIMITQLPYDTLGREMDKIEDSNTDKERNSYEGKQKLKESKQEQEHHLSEKQKHTALTKATQRFGSIIKKIKNP